MMHNGISGVTNDNVTPILWATDDPQPWPPYDYLVWGLHLFINPAYFFLSILHLIIRLCELEKTLNF